MTKLNFDFDKLIEEVILSAKYLVTTKLIGNYLSVFKGKGFEFDSFREYTLNDDSSLIDWKASMRSEKLLIRNFVEERDLEIFFLIDTSSTMLYGSTKEMKNEYVIKLLATIAYSSIKAGDKIGCALFTNKVMKDIPLSNNASQIFSLIDALTNTSNYGGIFDLKAALDFLLQNLRKNTLVIIVSDFIMLDNDWISLFEEASQKFDLLGFMVRDPRDITLPNVSAEVLIQDPITGEKMLTEPDTIKKAYLKANKTEINKIKNSFFKTNSDFALFVTNSNFMEELLMLFNRRIKKWR